MGIKTKVALAAAFVGVAVMTATAFGQSGSGTSTTSEPTAQSSPDRQPGDRRPGAAERRARRDERRCPPPAAGRRLRLVHRESKQQVRDGFAVATVDQGRITKIAGRTVTIERLDGESVSATATGDTKVCKDGEPSTFDALKVGDLARLIQVRSPKVNGLRRIAAFTPRSDEPAASPADFTGDEFAELSGDVY
jgi:hypothetical protein